MAELNAWQKQFKIKKDLVELDIEKLEAALIGLPRLTLTQTANASKLKAAIEAGWITAPPCECGEFNGEKRYFYDGKNIDEMHAGAVRWLGNQIDDAYSLAIEIPKNL